MIKKVIIQFILDKGDDLLFDIIRAWINKGGVTEREAKVLQVINKLDALDGDEVED